MFPDRLQKDRPFLDRPKCSPNLDPRTPYLLPKYFKNIRKYGNILGNMKFSYMRILFFKCSRNESRGTVLCLLNFVLSLFLKFVYLSFYNILWRWGSGNNDNCINEISKILDMNFISIKSMTWKFANFSIFKWGKPQHPSIYRLPPLQFLRMSPLWETSWGIGWGRGGFL